MILLENVNFSYENNQEVLHDFSLHIARGESVGLIGANGAGKSTFMKSILGLISCTGYMRVCGLEMNKANIPEIRKRLGYVLQNSDNQMFMPTVIEDMTFGLLNYGMTQAEAGERADEVLKEMGLEYLRHKYNHKISGGEKRMAAIATVLAMDPCGILMDEPSSSLDPANRRTIINMINKLDVTKLIASHDLDMIYETCSRVILISDGRVAADGPVETILHDKALLEANRLELPLRFQ